MQSMPTPTGSRRTRRPPRGGPDAVIDALTAAQHGVVSRGRHLEAGLSSDQVDRRVKRGRLGIVHRGIYRVGPVPDPDARQMAPCLHVAGPQS